jgi:flavin reductase (DIM6/NTAB) family NADH-FMN oxidoreductase RutF
MTVTPDEFRDTMSSFASGVTVVTGSNNMTVHAATMTAFCSVSVSPPRVLICVSKGTRSHKIISAGGVFAVNILTESQRELARTLASSESSGDSGTNKLDKLLYTTKVTGAPILLEHYAFIDCTIIESVDAGDHTIFFGQPEAVGTNTNEAPLIYNRKQFGQFSVDTDTQPFNLNQT